MTTTERKRYLNLDWDTYTKLPGHSFSALRNPDRDATFTPTAKMQLGSAVDAFIFTPDQYNGEMYDLVRPVAKELHKVLGESIKHGQPQASLTAKFHHEGFTLPYRGRTDLIIGNLVVDLKVSELPIHSAISFFRYDWQLAGYCAGSGCSKAMLISIHPKSHKITMTMIPLVYDWWEHKILTYGIPVQTV